MTSIDVNTKVTLMLGLSEKDFKEAILKMFHWTMKNMMETNEKKKSLNKEPESQQRKRVSTKNKQKV